MAIFKMISDHLLFYSSILILLVSLILSLKTRFVQFRTLPQMIRLLFVGKKEAEVEDKSTLKTRRALLTAMSTTIGISTIVSPVIAIRLGGPGAVLGFIVATLLGTAVNFTEVTLALSFRKKMKGKVFGGPMQYLQDAVHPFVAKWYAFFGFILLMGWSGAQANQLGEILNSPLLGDYRIPSIYTGIFLAISVTAILLGGVKWVASCSAKLVPMMFLVYVGSCLWIIGSNLDQIPAAINLVIESCLSPQSFATGATVGGIMGALRWGVFKGLQSNEAGIGTQTIPHSLAETEDPVDQGILSMVSTYCAGFICILSSLVTLITQTWLSDTLSVGINMVAASFHHYFSSFGIFIIAISAFLFGFGTILGNCFNGSHCFAYLSKGRHVKLYFYATALLVVVGCTIDVTTVWSFIDVLLLPVVLPHILSVAYIAFTRKELLQKEVALPEGALS